LWFAHLTIVVLQSSYSFFFCQDYESSAVCCEEADVDETQSHMEPVVLEIRNLTQYVTPSICVVDL